MKNSTAHLQKVFACLATRSSWIDLARNNPPALQTLCQLNDDEFNLLAEFLLVQGERVALSAMLGEEKRWRELMFILKNTVNWFGELQLKKQWRPYLNSYAFDAPIPENALQEAIQFLHFLPKNTGDLIGDAIIHYDILQNSVLLYEFPQSFADHPNLSIDHSLFDRPYLAQLNPSLIVQEFLIPVSKIINFEPVFMKNSIKHQSEMIGFYKSVQQENVRSIRLRQELISLLSLLRLHPLVSECWQQSAMAQKPFIELLQRLNQAEIVFITPLKKEDHGKYLN